MRRLAIVIGLAAVSGLTLLGCLALRSSVYGDVGVMAVAMCSGFAAWVANAFAKGIAQDAAATVRDCGFSCLKEAAGAIDMDLAQASRQLSGGERFDYARWATVHPKFEAAFAARRAQRTGGYTVIEDGIVATAIGALTQLLDHGMSRGAAA